MIALAETQAPDWLSSLRLAVFYAVPHTGSPVATWGTYTLTKSVLGPHPATRDLHGSSRLFSLNETLRNHMDIHSCSLGETLPSPVPFLLGRYEYIVPPDASSPGFGIHKLIVNSSHVDICKPSSKEDVRYTTLLQFVHCEKQHFSKEY